MNRNLNKNRINKSASEKRGRTNRPAEKSRLTGKEKRSKFESRDGRDSQTGRVGRIAGSKKAAKSFKPEPVARNRPVKSATTGEMRLNRFIANAGVCSRREADKFIAAGLVTVNGKTTTELGVKVKMTDDVRFDGRKLNAEKKVYLLLNKPKDYVTTTGDPHADRTVMDLIRDACEERVYPVGRLDKSTTGVLLFTNDGELSDRLTHPGHRMKKIYQVTLDKPLTKNHLVQIADGIELEDGPIAADAISYIDQTAKNEIGIEIHSGRNRIVRRLFEHLGYRVRKLDRVYFAGLTKKNLPRGKWRFLSHKEVQFLQMK